MMRGWKVKFEFLEEPSSLAFVVRVNELLSKGWTRSGPVIVTANRGHKTYYQAFEKTGVGNE
jgi:hypothetical protein